ncbi:hypothetical protein E2C01_067296 [Portunus trituberculatus]|uniref:Uncharacterized protein n=1 Tax=Portunus trituberculatus TaxID=210409 RepID=A0A5B7HKL5_PORTR|nr:hypothetical protein [Portunus trituberculatus]
MGGVEVSGDPSVVDWPGALERQLGAQYHSSTGYTLRHQFMLHIDVLYLRHV